MHTIGNSGETCCLRAVTASELQSCITKPKNVANMAIDAEEHQLQHHLADRWVAIERRLQAAERQLCKDAKSTQPTADVAADERSCMLEGQRPSCRWSNLEARLLSIEQSLGLVACNSQLQPSQHRQSQQLAVCRPFT